jgi:hypothetical protein
MIGALTILNPGFLLGAPAISALDYANIVDTSGNGKHLTLGGQTPPAVVTDAFGTGINGLLFAGISNAIAEGEKFDNNLSNYTIEFRFKRNTAKNGIVQVIFARWGNGASGTTSQFLCYFDAANKLNYYNNYSGAAAIASAATTDGNAHTVALVRTGTNLKMFIDGAQVSSVTCGTPVAVANSVPFRLGCHDDDTGGAAIAPFWGTIGDFRMSNISRYSSAYTPSTSNLTSDANTLALLKMNELKGTYLDTAVFQSNILLRTGYTQASGGWANPDGYHDTLDGKKFFSVSAYNGTIWTVWAAIANTISGPWTVQATAIQTPGTGEGDLAGNGSVVPFLAKYWHYYHDNPNTTYANIRYSFANTLNEVYPQGTIIFTGGVGGYNKYVDPIVRPIWTGLEMFFVGETATTFLRFMLRSTSTDGITWTTPTVLGSMMMPFNKFYPGEVCSIQLGSSIYAITGDGASASSGVGREVVRWASKDGVRILPLLKFFSPQPGYSGVYDSSLYFDGPNARLIFLSTHSTNTAPTQPTNSDIGVWYVPIINNP